MASTVCPKIGLSCAKTRPKRDWRKRRRKRRFDRRRMTCTIKTAAQQEANAEATVALNDLTKPSSSSTLNHYESHHTLADVKNSQKLSKQSEVKFSSRGAMMLSMARGFAVNSGFTKPLAEPLVGNSRHSEDRKKKRSATSECRTDLRELNPEYLEYLSGDQVGSESYGQCFCARYCNIDVLVKQMINNNHGAWLSWCIHF